MLQEVVIELTPVGFFRTKLIFTLPFEGRLLYYKVFCLSHLMKILSHWAHLVVLAPELCIPAPRFRLKFIDQPQNLDKL